MSGTIPATWFSAPSTLPVVAERPGWLEVRLAQRPNGSTAWVQAADVDLAVTPYRIVIDLATTHLTLYRMDSPSSLPRSGSVRPPTPLRSASTSSPSWPARRAPATGHS
jgi:hypothetical protein